MLFLYFVALYFFFSSDVNAILSLEYVHEEQIKEEMIIFGFWMSLRKTFSYCSYLVYFSASLQFETSFVFQFVMIFCSHLLHLNAFHFDSKFPPFMCDIFQFLTVFFQVLVFKVSCLFTASRRTKAEGKKTVGIYFKTKRSNCCLYYLLFDPVNYFLSLSTKLISKNGVGGLCNKVKTKELPNKVIHLVLIM